MPDGHIAMWFGYLNRNFKELGDVPIGPNNRFDREADMGQPTRFYPRRHLFVFKVDLPRDWAAGQRLVWTVNFHGKPATASGWLQPEWEVNNEILMENLGGGIDLDNQPPAITGSSAQIQYCTGEHSAAARGRCRRNQLSWRLSCWFRRNQTVCSARIAA